MLILIFIFHLHLHFLLTISYSIINMFFEKLYYGNSLFAWASTFALIIVCLIISRLVYWFFKTVLGKLTKKTKTNLDDIIVDMIEEPTTFMVALLGIQFSLHNLKISESVSEGLDYSFDFIFTIAGTWMVARLYDALHKEYLIPIVEKTESQIDDHILPIVRKGLLITIWSLGILVALNNAGYDVSAVLAGLGIGGFAFALAVQHTFGNMVGSVIIYLDKHVKVGDRVQIKGTLCNIDGTIQEIGIRTSTIKTRYEGRLVSIPNSMMTNQELVNVDSEDGRQLFGVYKMDISSTTEDIELTMKILKEAVKSTEGTKDAVVSGFIKMSEVSFDVMLLYWIGNDFSKIKTRSVINLKILEGFKQNGLKFSDKTQMRYNLDVEY